MTVALLLFIYFSFVRRVVPYQGTGADPAAIVPLLGCLPLAWRSVTKGMRRDLVLFSAWCSLSVFVGTVSIGVAGWLSIVPCLLAGNAVANNAALKVALARRLVFLSMPAFAYTIFQYYDTPRWDARWLASVQLMSVGIPGTSSFRPFGVFPSPATAASIAVIVILCCVFGRDDLELSLAARLAASALAAGTLVFSQTRAAWLALLVGLMAGLLLGRGRHRLLKVLAVAMGGAALFLVPALSTVVMSRGESLGDLSSDRSYNDRFALLTSFGQYLSVLGKGIGAYSSGSRAVQNSTLDNTFIVLVGELGIVGLVLGTIVLLRQLSTRQQLSLSVGVALLVAAVSAPVLTNVIAFLSLGFGPRGGIRRRRKAAPPGRSGDEIRGDTTAWVS